MANTTSGSASSGRAAEKTSPPARTPEPALIGRPLDNCPGCGSWQLQPVVDIDAEGVHFLCGSCSRCWHVELGYVRRVNPGDCDGCPQSALCSAVYVRDHTPR